MASLNNINRVCGCGDFGHANSSWCIKCDQCVDCCAMSDCEEFVPYAMPVFEPKVFDGPPPKALARDPVSNNYMWACECGDQGISTDEQWAHSDVNRHRQLIHVKKSD